MEHRLEIWISQADLDYLATLQVHTGQPVSAIVQNLLQRARCDHQPPGGAGALDGTPAQLLALIVDISSHTAALLRALLPVVADGRPDLAVNIREAALLMRISTAALVESGGGTKEEGTPMTTEGKTDAINE